jgi:hypothetical protein
VRTWVADRNFEVWPDQARQTLDLELTGHEHIWRADKGSVVLLKVLLYSNTKNFFFWLPFMKCWQWQVI